MLTFGQSINKTKKYTTLLEYKEEKPNQNTKKQTHHKKKQTWKLHSQYRLPMTNIFFLIQSVTDYFLMPPSIIFNTKYHYKEQRQQTNEVWHHLV